MLLVAYDISNTKLRTQFSKFIKKFGYRLQYSVYKIKNSEKMLQKISLEIKMNYEKKFTAADSILIFKIPENSKPNTIKFGYAKNEDTGILFG